MPILLVKRPRYGLIKMLDGRLSLLGYMAHNRVDHLALVVPLLTLDYVLWRHSALGKIDITCFNPC